MTETARPAQGGRRYVVERLYDGTVSTLIVDPDGIPCPLRHIRFHGGGGVEYGDLGGAAADLALSILCDALGENPGRDDVFYRSSRAWRHHQAFKRTHIATVNRRLRRWTVTQKMVLDFVDQHEMVCPQCQGQQVCDYGRSRVEPCVWCDGVGSVKRPGVRV